MNKKIYSLAASFIIFPYCIADSVNHAAQPALLSVAGPVRRRWWAMKYLEQYRAELLSALKSIDLGAVDRIVDIFREARARGRCIFVCAGGRNAVAASRLLCDMVRASNVNRSMKFRIFVICDELPATNTTDDYMLKDAAIVDELKNVASPDDVVVGIYASGNSRPVLQAFQYANRIGCRTICIAGWADDKLAAVSDAAILVPGSHAGNVEDTHMVICRMIGTYFVNSEED